MTGLDTSAATTVEGIDVSGENGLFDWGPHAGRIGFTAIRATSWVTASTFNQDLQVEDNGAATWDLRIPRIWYHETRPGAGGARVQAREVIEVLGGHLCHGDMLAAAMEESDGDPPAFVAQWHHAFLSALNEHAPGHRVLAYCDPYWASLGNTAGLDAWHLWLADWDVTWPRVPQPWRRWAFWQYTSTGGPGGAPLDRDLWHGTVGELRAFARFPDWRLRPGM
jgi:lysozyme